MAQSGRGNLIARNLPRGQYTVKDAARMIGVSPDTLKRWCEAGIMPFHTREAGKLVIKVFTRSHIATGRRIRERTGTLQSRARPRK